MGRKKAFNNFGLMVVMIASGLMGAFYMDLWGWVGVFGLSGGWLVWGIFCLVVNLSRAASEAEERGTKETTF
jgi:hypothetical protein